MAFEEKPAHPTGTITGIALYYFAKSTVAMFDTYIKEGNNPDQPGRFIQWLYPRLGVHTHRSAARGSTSAARKRWKKRTGFSRNSSLRAAAGFPARARRTSVKMNRRQPGPGCWPLSRPR